MANNNASAATQEGYAHDAGIRMAVKVGSPVVADAQRRKMTSTALVQSAGWFGRRSGCLGSLPRSLQYSSRCHNENRVAHTARIMVPVARMANLIHTHGSVSIGRTVRITMTGVKTIM